MNKDTREVFISSGNNGLYKNGIFIPENKYDETGIKYVDVNKNNTLTLFLYIFIIIIFSLILYVYL